MSNTAMEPAKISNQLSIKHCSLCPGTTEYYCHYCGDDLCRSCKEMHVDILDIKYHDVTIYRGKFNSSRGREMCTEHPGQVIEMFCELCDSLICTSCTNHTQHEVELISRAHENKRKQLNNILIKISFETIYSAQVLLNKLQSEYTTCHSEIGRLKTAMLTRSKRLKDFMDNVRSETILKCKARFLMQKIKLKINNARIQKYEHRYEKSVNKPVQFLQFIKKARLPLIQDTPKDFLFSLTQKIDTDDLIKLLSEIKITESRKQRRTDNEFLLTLMSTPILQKKILLRGDAYKFYHISCVTLDRVWVSIGPNILILLDTTTGDILHYLKDSLVFVTGKHTVNSDRELIYIDKHFNIMKLSVDMKTTMILIENPGPAWTPLCVYCSPYSGYLLAGMFKYDKYTKRNTGKVMKYDNNGKHTQTILHNDLPGSLYNPRYISENNNGDIVVSDWDRHAVMVMSGKGLHRFSYRGLYPQAVCTDALSHILVCYTLSRTIHMLTQNGEFLTFLSTNQSDYRPYSLGYDLYSHCLWVGLSLRDNLLSVYRHINRHPAILDES